MPPAESPLPDHYAIPQVHPQAEPEVIRAAYRLLMRKYHPDSLPEEQRQDIELLKRVRLINIAYDVLSDPAQRAAYDAARSRQAETPSPLAVPGLETRIHLVRCARTRQTYKMLLARRAGISGLFRVTGFELIEEKTPGLLGESHPAPRLALPAGQAQASPLQSLLEKALPRATKQPPPSGPAPKFPAPAELQDLFNTSDALSFSEIDWAGFNCPACHTDFKMPQGVVSQWCHCSACRRIYCSGNLRQTPLGIYGSCPWCGRVAKITSVIHPGEAVDLPVRGEVGRSRDDLPKLDGGNRPRLPEK